jgi:thiamine pyrophosphokinase
VKRALVLCNGDPPSRPLADRIARGVEFLVAADGGANSARALGLRPDLLIGDLDSVTPATRRFFPHLPTIQVSRQDNTDLEKALDYLAVHRVAEVIILGATGRRVDFTLGNFSLLWNYPTFKKLFVAGDGWYAIPIRRGRTVHARKGSTVSLIPFSPCRGITLRGLHYPLRNASMRTGEIGVSNVVRQVPFSVRVKSGAMMLFVLEDFAWRAGKAP